MSRRAQIAVLTALAAGSIHGWSRLPVWIQGRRQGQGRISPEFREWTLEETELLYGWTIRTSPDL